MRLSKKPEEIGAMYVKTWDLYDGAIKPISFSYLNLSVLLF